MSDIPSLTDAIKAAGNAAAVESAQRRRASGLPDNAMINMRMVAIDLAHRAAAGKQWTPEQFREATEFYYGFLTADDTKP